MAKCSVCGNKIEYNQYSIIKGKVYCPKCAVVELGKAETIKKAKTAVPKEAVALETVIKNSGVSLDELAAAISTVPKKKPSKKKHADDCQCKACKSYN